MTLWTVCAILSGLLFSSTQSISSCPNHTKSCSAHLQCRFGELGTEMQKVLANTSTETDPNSDGAHDLDVDYLRHLELVNIRISTHSKNLEQVAVILGKLNEEVEHLTNIIEEDIDSHESERTIPNNYIFCPIARSCQEILFKARMQRRAVASGVFTIKPSPESEAFEVYCDLNTNGGGWAVIQQRSNGDEDFSRSWLEYKNGFGQLSSEFWLGLEHIYAITGLDPNELLIHLEDANGNSAGFKSYQFSLGSEEEGYAIKLLDKNLGPSLSQLTGIRFSTTDKDNEGGCAKAKGGGWWFNKDCTGSNLNGEYPKGGNLNNGIFWDDFKVSNRVKITTMMVRARAPKVG